MIVCVNKNWVKLVWDWHRRKKGSRDHLLIIKKRVRSRSNSYDSFWNPSSYQSDKMYKICGENPCRDETGKTSKVVSTVLCKSLMFFVKACKK